MNKLLTLALAGTLVLGTSLAGCRSAAEAFSVGEAADRNVGPCPRAFALHDASRIVDFRGGEQAYDNVGFTGQITEVGSLCRYVGDNPITGDVEITFELGRGPAATENFAQYNYWVAIMRKNIAVIDKQTFPLRVTFPDGVDRVTVTERVPDYTIARADPTTSGENFEIVVGFDVTPEQRAWNAEGRRFRIGVGQN